MRFSRLFSRSCLNKARLPPFIMELTSPSFSLGKVEVASTPAERFEEYLQTKGMRNTEQRRLMIDYVFSQHEHFDADGLIDRLPRKGKPGYVSRPTVYRTLNEFVDAGLLRKFEDHLEASYLPDGSYGEGISYQEFDLETTALACEALDRVFGIDYWRRSRLLDSLAYALYTLTDPASASPDMGDTHPPTGRTIAPLVVRAKSPVLRWFYDRFRHQEIRDLLFFDDTIRPQPPDRCP